jgi:BlaI family penicillinase repressor
MKEFLQMQKEERSMGEIRHLPESELDIMLVVWKAGEPVAAPCILERLERPLTASALHSYLKRLEEKGFLKCEKAGKINRYQALISRADYERQEGKSVLSKLYAGSLKRFAAALYDGGALSGEDVAELRAYLDTLGKE